MIDIIVRAILFLVNAFFAFSGWLFFKPFIVIRNMISIYFRFYKNHDRDMDILVLFFLVTGTIIVILPILFPSMLLLKDLNLWSMLALCVFFLHIFMIVMHYSFSSLSLSFIMLFVVNGFITVGINKIIQSVYPKIPQVIAEILIFIFLWINYSLVSDAGVAKLSNEIITGISAFAFTIVNFLASNLTEEYLINFAFKNYTAPADQIQSAFDQIHMGGWTLSRALLLLSGIPIPLIVLTSISVILINLKQYIIRKYKKDLQYGTIIHVVKSKYFRVERRL